MHALTQCSESAQRSLKADSAQQVSSMPTPPGPPLTIAMDDGRVTYVEVEQTNGSLKSLGNRGATRAVGV